MHGLFIDNGPFRLDYSGDDIEVDLTSDTWFENVNLLYLDQPMGTGFSEYKNRKMTRIDKVDDINMENIASSIVTFLVEFYSIHPEMQPQHLIIAGDSFAGTYIPYVASEILEWNTDLDRVRIKLIGIALQDAILDYQLQAVYVGNIPMANGLLTDDLVP